jgi:hypothetical protein
MRALRWSSALPKPVAQLNPASQGSGATKSTASAAKKVQEANPGSTAARARSM